MNLLAFIVAALFTAANVVLYLYFGHHWWSLGAVIFCGMLGLWSLTRRQEE